MGDMCDVLRAEVELDCSTTRKKKREEGLQFSNILRPMEPCVCVCVIYFHVKEICIFKKVF